MPSFAIRNSHASKRFRWLPPWTLPAGPTAPGRRGRRPLAAFTLIEVLVAAGVVLTSLGAIFMASSRCIGIIRSSHTVAVASAILQERMQQLQAAGWETVTDSESYTDQVWSDPEDGTTENVDGLLKNATQSGSAQELHNIVESVRVSAYRPIAVAEPEPAAITANRNATTATLTSAATNLVDEKMVRLDLRVTWTEGQAALPRSLGSSAIIARK